jgi:hypothetical protein
VAIVVLAAFAFATYIFYNLDVYTTERIDEVTFVFTFALTFTFTLTFGFTFTFTFLAQFKFISNKEKVKYTAFEFYTIFELYNEIKNRANHKEPSLVRLGTNCLYKALSIPF